MMEYSAVGEGLVEMSTPLEVKEGQGPGLHPLLVLIPPPTCYVNILL